MRYREVTFLLLYSMLCLMIANAKKYMYSQIIIMAITDPFKLDSRKSALSYEEL